MAEQNKNYDDIINLPHPTSRKHPRMSSRDRAAQFAPFAALTGHQAAIKETARFTDEKPELSEDAIERLNEQLNMINEALGNDCLVKLTYFEPDLKKTGGFSVSCEGIVKKIDQYDRVIIMDDKRAIPIEQIIQIEIE